MDSKKKLKRLERRAKATSKRLREQQEALETLQDTLAALPRRDSTAEAPAGADGPKADDGDVPRGLLGNTLRGIGKFVGGVAGGVALLFVTGYLADQATYRFAGLPLLSMDQQSMAESGARVFIETVGALLDTDEALRLTLLIGSLLFVALMLAYSSTWRWVQALRRRPWVYLLARAAHLTLAAGLLIGVLAISEQAGPQQYQLRSQAVATDLAALRSDSRWNPVSEDEVLARSTYPTRGLLAFFAAALDDRPPPNPDDLLDINSELWGPGEIGHPLRRLRIDRDNARRLYGWLVFTLALLVLGGLGLRRWWTWLSENEIGAASGTWYSPDPADLLRVGHGIFARLAAVLILVCIVLLPTSFGVLMAGFIGEEEVTVHLAAETSCMPRPLVVNGEDNPPTVKQQNILSLVRAPDVRAAAPPDDQGQRCAAGAVEIAEKLQADVAKAWQNLLMSQDEGLAAYRLKLDKLAEHAADHPCLSVLESLDSALPDPAGFQRLPRASEYALSVWREVKAAVGVARHGVILRQPRGENEPLVLLRPLTRRTPTKAGRWLMHVLPQGCIRDIIVADDARRLKVVENYQRAQGGDVGALDALTSLSRENAVAMLALLHGGQLDVATLGPFVTGGGYAIGLYGAEPELQMLGVDLLIRLIRQPKDPKENPEVASVAGAANTALYLIGGPYAARRFATLLDDTDEPSTGFCAFGQVSSLRPILCTLGIVPLFTHRALRGTATTTAGHLRAALERWVSAAQAPGDWSEASLAGLQDYLVRLLHTGVEHHRGGAAAGLSMSSVADSVAEQIVERMIGLERLIGTERFTVEEAMELGGLLETASTLAIEPARKIARRLARRPQLQDRLRKAALGVLFRLGAYREVDVIVELSLQTGPVADTAEELLDGIDPIRASDKLLDIAIDDTSSNARRRRALELLMRLESLESVAVSYRLTRQLNELPSDLRGVACLVLMKLNPFAAEFARDECATLPPTAARPTSVDGEPRPISTPRHKPSDDPSSTSGSSPSCADTLRCVFECSGENCEQQCLASATIEAKALLRQIQDCVAACIQDPSCDPSICDALLVQCAGQ